MKLAPVDDESKHLFDKIIDSEQVFVMGWRHGEQRFDGRPPVDGLCGVVTPAQYNVFSTDARTDDRDPDGKDLPMTALLTAPLPELLDDGSPHPGRPQLRLVEAPGRRGVRDRPTGEADGRGPAPALLPRRRASFEVRRRRTLLAMMGLALTLLALPLGGFGGDSHISESASAVQLHAGTYVVRPGDSLWSIAQRVDPTGDPRPIVSQLASELGTYSVVPGEQVTIP